MTAIDKTSQGPGHGGPARGYSWPPFQPGHELSLKHGAYSSVLRLKPRVDEIVAQLRNALGEDFDPKFTPAVEAAALAGARVEAAAGVLLDELDEEKSLRLSADARSWLRTYVGILERLGLTPQIGSSAVVAGPVVFNVITAFPGVRPEGDVIEVTPAEELPEETT